MKRHFKNIGLVISLSTSVITQLKAQIDYTDIIPNQVVTNSNFTIDMDNDGTVDFTIKQTNGIGVEIELPAGSGVVIPPNPPGFAAALSCQTAVNSSSSFFDVVAAVPMYAYSVGYWSGAVDKCLGVKFTSGATTYYGWIRLDVAASGNTATVKDFAYNTQSINTCDMGSSLGIELMSNSVEFNVYPTVFDSDITIEAAELAQCTIYDQLGLVVKETTVYSPKTSISLVNLIPGFYFVSLVDQSGNKSVYKVIKD